MIALFFEVLPRPGQDTAYLDMAAKLKPALDANGGLTFLDRSRSASRPGWYLSHQFWTDEASMVRWRQNPTHHRAQVCGRTDILADYRLRVADVIAGTDVSEPTVATTNDRLVLSVLSTGALPHLPGEAFASVYDNDLAVTLVPAGSAKAAAPLLASLEANPTVRAARLCRVTRDYGMFDRREAPQHFDPVTLA